MKVKFLFLISILCIVLYGCDDSESESQFLTLSKSSFNDISQDGEALTVDITSSAAWTVSQTPNWCTVTPKSGSGNGQLIIKVNANQGQTERTGTVSVALSSYGISKNIQLSQNAGHDISVENYHYELPIIFHVLYQNQTDPLQYVSQNRLSTILNAVNNYYKDAQKSVDMNLTFTLATANPDGGKLASPGVEYIKRGIPYRL